MDHDEHPAIGCVRETLEEMGIHIELTDDAPIITQRIFTNEGISFVSFTYQANWNGDNSEINLKENEISEFAWLTPSEALSRAVSDLMLPPLDTYEALCCIQRFWKSIRIRPSSLSECRTTATSTINV